VLLPSSKQETDPDEQSKILDLSDMIRKSRIEPHQPPLSESLLANYQPTV